MHHLSTTLNSSSNVKQRQLFTPFHEVRHIARSVANKLRDLHAGENIDIIALSQKHTDTKLMVPNRSVFRRDRNW